MPISNDAGSADSKSSSDNPQKPQAPYRLRVMPAVEAAVLESTVRNTALDGLSIYRWMLENGFVQVAPTQMEYLSLAKDPMEVRTRIIIPVVVRRSGLKLPKE